MKKIVICLVCIFLFITSICYAKVPAEITQRFLCSFTNEIEGPAEGRTITVSRAGERVGIDGYYFDTIDYLEKGYSQWLYLYSPEYKINVRLERTMMFSDDYNYIIYFAGIGAVLYKGHIKNNN